MTVHRMLLPTAAPHNWNLTLQPAPSPWPLNPLTSPTYTDSSGLVDVSVTSPLASVSSDTPPSSSAALLSSATAWVQLESSGLRVLLESLSLRIRIRF